MDDIEIPAGREYNKDELGQASFFLNSLLNPYNLKFKLQSTVYPKKKYFDNERTNLELNSTARKKAKDLIGSATYMDESTTLVISFELAFPLGTFVPPKQEAVAIDPKAKASQPPKGKAPVLADTHENEDAIPEETETDILRRTQLLGLKPKTLPFERSVYIFSYKNKEFLQSLQ